MKNTKHTENLDNSTPQEITSQSKRKILTSIGVSSGIIGASALSQQWTKPIVNSIILPAHAQSTPMMTTMAMGDMTTTPSMSDGMDDGTTTTMMPTTTMAPAPASRIMVVAGQTGNTIGDDSTAEFHISLTEQPLNDVMVTVSADPPTGRIGTIAGGTDGVFTFTRANYKTEQTVMLTAVDSVPPSPMVTIKFAAEGGGYDDEENSVMLTIVENDNLAPTGLKATAGTGTVKVDWTAPDTVTMPARYIVQLAAGGIAPDAATLATADSTTLPYVKNVTSGTSYTFMNVPAGVMYSCMVVAVYAEDGDDGSGRFIPAAAGATTSKVVG